MKQDAALSQGGPRDAAVMFFNGQTRQRYLEEQNGALWAEFTENRAAFFQILAKMFSKHQISPTRDFSARKTAGTHTSLEFSSWSHWERNI